MPVTTNVISYDSQNAQWLITCPKAPNPTDTLEYLNSPNTQFIAGDECLTNSTPLSSKVCLNVIVNWSDTILANVILNVSGTNLANLSVSNLAYSGESYNYTGPRTSTTTSVPTVSTVTTFFSTTIPACTCGEEDIDCDVAQCHPCPGSCPSTETAKCGSNAYTFHCEASTTTDPPSDSAPLASSTTTFITTTVSATLHLPRAVIPKTTTYTTVYQSTTLKSTSISTTLYSTTTTIKLATCAACGDQSESCGVAQCICPASCPQEVVQPPCSEGKQNAYCIPVYSTTLYSTTTTTTSSTTTTISLPQAYISSGYDSASNIFQGVPSSKQSGVWSWHAKVANLSLANTSQLSQSDWINLIYNTKDSSGDACQYDYNLSVQASISSLQNGEAPVPVAPSTSGGDYLSFNNVTYTGFTTGQQYGANAIAMNSCYLPNFWTQWHLVSTSGAMNYQGSTQSPVCVYQYGNVPEYWSANVIGGTLTTGYVMANTLSFGDSSVLPYLLYNISLPTIVQTLGSTESFLNSSYDLYSAHNLQSPGNFLDPFLIGGTSDGSSIFMNVNGVLAQLSAPTFFGNPAASPTSPIYNGLQIQATSFVVQQNATIASTYGLSNAQAIGPSYSIASITNAILFAEASNNNFFVLSNISICSSSNPANENCFINNAYYIYRLQYFPAGYFSTPDRTPSQAAPTNAPSATAYSANVESYLSNVSSLQQGGYYITSMYNVTKLWYPAYYTYPKPIAMASDAGGDLFVLAANVMGTCYGSGNGCSAYGFDLFYISSSGQVLFDNVTSSPEYNTWLGSIIFGSSPQNTSFTVSPTGQYLYVSTKSIPYVFIYTAKVVNGLNSTYLTAINLSYSTPAYNLSITKYLGGGGPYNSSALKSLYAPGSPNLKNLNDTPTAPSGYSSHWPIGLAESQGILYVLDDWFIGEPPLDAGGNPAAESILMLRAFTYNGTEIPIDAATYDDVIPKSYLNLGTGYVAGQLYPPYGLPISANFSVPKSLGSNHYSYLSYCAYGCTYSPLSSWSQPAYNALLPDYSWITNSSPPVGPFLGAESPPTPGKVVAWTNPLVIPFASFTADLNNTLYLNAWAYAYPTSFCTLETPVTAPPISSSCSQFYAELAGIHFNPQNYTRIAANPQISYACYLGINTSPTNIFKPSSPSGTTCTTVANLSRQKPPALGIPDPFSYAESLGSPSAYLSGPLSLTTLYPSLYGGADPPSQPTLAISPTTISTGTSVTISATCQPSTDNCAIDYPNLGTQIAIGTGSATDTFTPGTAGSFCYYYANDITTGLNSAGQCLAVTSSSGLSNSSNIVIGNSISISIPSIPAGLAASKLKSDISGYILVPINYTYSLTRSYSPSPDLPAFGDPSSCGSISLPAQSTQSFQVHTDVLQSASESQLNESLASGFVIGQYQNNNKYYEANLSDAGLILPPQIFLNIFSNRIFGEMYINQSMNPRGPSLGGNGPSSFTGSSYGSILIAADPVIQGYPDQITLYAGSETAGDALWFYVLNINGNQVAASPTSSSGSVALTICASSNSCLPPGYYSIEAYAMNPIQTLIPIFPQLIVRSSASLGDVVINATHTFNYSQINFEQMYGGGIVAPGFSEEAALQLNPQAIGAVCSFCTLPYYYNPANLFVGNNSLSHSGPLQTNLVALFSQFKVMTHLDVLDLSMLYNAKVLGYNRLNYSYTDQFNNTINMPMDVDLANITLITLNVSSVINSSNPNSTFVKVKGIAGYYPSFFSVTPSPIPEGSPIYLYYDTNINFYNQSLNPSSNPDAYYTYALQCAFGSVSGPCAFADPSLMTLPPLGQGPVGLQQAQTINFHSQFNTTGQCSPEPNSLLIAPNTTECNIYPGNQWGLPTSGTSAQGVREYCIPDYTNGTGVLTTQLGLMDIATAGINGNFSYNFTVCGTGTARLQASYYGYPVNQPQLFFQTPLQTRPSLSSAGGTSVPLVGSPEFNYSIAPNTTVKSIQIGSYYLSLGEIASILGISIVAGIFCYLLLRDRFSSKD